MVDRRPAFSVRSLAERWECSEALIRKLIHSGKLQRLPFALMRISAAEVDRYEGVTGNQANSEPATPPPAPATERAIVPGSGLPYWPQAMRLRTAAAYCDLSEASFQREVFSGRLPRPFSLGGRDHWRRDAIDKALDVFFGSVEEKTGEDAPWRVAVGKRYAQRGQERAHAEEAKEALKQAQELLGPIAMGDGRRLRKRT